MLFHNEEKQNSIRIRFARDSVSMGDDCMAPHADEMLFKTSDTWLDLLNAASKYVPAMYDYKWEVMCDAEVIGTLTSGSEAEYRVEAKQTDAVVSALPLREIFCRKKEEIENMTYFESLEVLYDGEYFSATSFREYGNAARILEEEETKITTRDKAFAMKHGFEHRMLGNYDKILPIDQFEGMQIVRTPNDSNAEAIRFNIPKEKIMEELKKRAKSPHDVISDGILAYGVDVGRFVYEEEGYTVYVITDFPHIGPSDVFMVYQISKADYEKLLPLSCTGRISEPPVSSDVTDACRKKFLCGESAYCERFYCALDDVDKALAERIESTQASSKQSKVMNYCPNCGRKNDGHNYCSECGTKLSTL